MQVLQNQNNRFGGRQDRQQLKHAQEQAVPGSEHVTGFLVRQQPSGLITKGGHERPVRQRRPCQRRRLADQDLRPPTAEATCAHSSSTSLVLPMPAAPVSNSSCVWPAAACA